MTRSKRAGQLRNMTDAQLHSLLREHLKRALWTMKELDALLATEGATWGRVGIVVTEVAGHLGRVVAICRVGNARKLTLLESKLSTEPKTPE